MLHPCDQTPGVYVLATMGCQEVLCRRLEDSPDDLLFCATSCKNTEHCNTEVPYRYIVAGGLSKASLST